MILEWAMRDSNYCNNPRKKPAITPERDAEYGPRCAELVAVDADLQQLITLAPAVGGQCTGSTPSTGHTVTRQRPLEGPLWAIDLEVGQRYSFARTPQGCG